MSGLDYVVLILFSLSLLVIGISKVSQTESSYLVADRRTGLFALLGGFYWKKSSRFGAYCSIFVGLICGAGSYMYWGEEGGYTWNWTVGGIPLIFLSGVIGSFCIPK